MRLPYIKIISILFLMGALFAMPAQAIPTVSLNVLDSDISIGENFDVQVLVDGDNIGLDLLAFGFDVATTGGAFSYDGYTLGAGFMDNSLGMNNVSGFAFPGISADDVLLATLSFTGTATGAGALSVQGLFDGMFGGLYYDQFQGFNVEASAAINVGGEPIPEPGTLLLLGTGLVGIAGYRKKKMKA